MNFEDIKVGTTVWYDWIGKPKEAEVVKRTGKQFVIQDAPDKYSRGYIWTKRADDAREFSATRQDCLLAMAARLRRKAAAARVAADANDAEAAKLEAEAAKETP